MKKAQTVVQRLNWQIEKNNLISFYEKLLSNELKAQECKV